MNDIDRKTALDFLLGLARLIKETGVEVANDTSTEIGLYNEASGRFIGSFIVEDERIELYCGDEEPIAVISKEIGDEPTK